MSILDRLRSMYLRIDARSLGLFRIAMGLALLGDWWGRWAELRAFYTNEGVLPNHAHLYNILKRDPPERVWSVFHAFSSPGEAGAGLLLALLVYVFFLIGYKTRVFHVLSLAVLVSFVGRNVLLGAPGNDVALVLLAATAFLPLGSRFSVDSLRSSFRRRNEKDATELNLRPALDDKIIGRERSPGWSPTSLAALAVLLHLVIVFVAIARRQVGDKWLQGSALHYALWVERYVSDLGILVRRAAPGLLKGWSQLLRFTPWMVPPLLFLPIPRHARTAVFWLMVVYGLSYGLLFSFGLWGWTFVAAAFLVIPTESWDRYQSSWAKGRALTVIYDADCGICLWVCKLLARLDLRQHLTFQGNDMLSVSPGKKPPYRAASDEDALERVLFRRKTPGSPVEAVALPAEVTDELVTATVVAVDESGRVCTEGRAISLIVRALPLGGLLSLPLRLPGTGRLWDALYRIVPPRRFAISEALGLGACGVPKKDEPSDGAEDAPDVAPSVKTRRALTFVAREAGAVLFLVASLAQTGKSGPFIANLVVPQNQLFSAISEWTRTLGRYDQLAPEPPSEDGVFVVDAQLRSGQSIDPLTGAPPSLEEPTFRLGFLWAVYTSHLHDKQGADLEKSLRDYLSTRRGRMGAYETPDEQILGLDAYWIRYKLPAPGTTAIEVVARDKLFTHSRGGKGGLPLPLLKPAPAVRR